MGLTVRNWHHLHVTVQKGKCGICSRTKTYLSKSKKFIRLSTDHVHLTDGREDPRLAAKRGQIRGVLCGKCNDEVDLTDLLENAEYDKEVKGEAHYEKVPIQQYSTNCVTIDCIISFLFHLINFHSSLSRGRFEGLVGLPQPNRSLIGRRPWMSRRWWRYQKFVLERSVCAVKNHDSARRSIMPPGRGSDN